MRKINLNGETKDSISIHVIKLSKILGHIPTLTEFKKYAKENGIVNMAVIKHLFGTWKDCLIYCKLINEDVGIWWRFVDLTGKTFNRLTVVKRVENDNTGGAQWLCECECKELTVVKSNWLTSGKVKSCGCANKINITGMRSGKLVAKQAVEIRKDGNVYWECKCDCENTRIVKAACIKNKTVKSCGCLITPRNTKSTTGINGIHFRKRDNRYVVDIPDKASGKYKRFLVGAFDDFERACQVRLDAEEAKINGCLEDWLKTVKPKYSNKKITKTNNE